jgi:hypothetical protein
MTKRRAWRLVAVLVALAALAVVVPGSPVYLPDWLSPSARHQGRSTRSWLAALNGPDDQARRDAIFALGSIGPAAAEAVPALATILVDSPDGHARQEAALALAKMAPASRSAVPALAQALADDELAVRMNAALALFRLGSEARPAIPALIQALRDERNQTNLGAFHHTIQEMAALALGRASAGSADAVPALTAALRADSDDNYRRAIVRALGEIGPEAAPAIPLLRVLIGDNDGPLQRAAQESLARITGKPTDTREQAGSGKPGELELSQAERAYLWEIEHHGNLLAKHGLAALAKALKTADAQALSRLMADDFLGADLHKPERVESRTHFAEVVRLQASGRPPVPLNRAAFVARLLQFRKVFGDKPPQVKVAVMTLSPSRRRHLAGGWEGTAQLRLYGEHAKGAPAEVVAVLHYQLARPTREALSRPGWLRAATVLQVLTAKAPQYLFAEVGRQRGFDTSKMHDNWKAAKFTSAPGGVYVCDFNRDGVLDVLITDVNGCALYQGRGDGTFEDVTDRCGLPRQAAGSHATAWIDIDGDGWEDLILAGRVYRNEGGKRFVDQTARCNLRLPRDAQSVIVADYDRDGKLDLYVTRTAPPGGSSWLEGRSRGSGGNLLFRNKGDWQFEDVTRASGTAGGRRSTFTAAWLDANNDGWPDLHVINEFGDGVLLINNRDGTFSERALANRPADFGSMGMAVGDIDNDGNIDIYCANMYSKAGTRVIGNLAADAYPPNVMEKMRRFVAGSQLHLNKGGGKFEQVGTQMQVAGVGWAYGACLADLDGDGWLDIYATCGFVSRNRNRPDG